MRGSGWRVPGAATLVLSLALCAACSREEAAPDPAAPAGAVRGADGEVTVSGDDSIADSLTWRPPPTDIAADSVDAARARADAALAAGALYADGESAIPLYLGVIALAPGDTAAVDGLTRAVARLLEEGRVALAASDDDSDARRTAHRIASVARSARPADPAVMRYLVAVDEADRLWELNRRAELELDAGRLGEAGGGALASARAALALRPGQPRAMQTLAAVESAMIRRAEDAAAGDGFDEATRWLDRAARVREDATTVEDARARVAQVRQGRIVRLRDLGIAALPTVDGIAKARAELGRMIAIAEPGNPAVAELRERIDLAVHYGLFRPGQRFTDAIGGGARGPRMVVLPHGGFRMGAADDDGAAADSERPQRYVHFDRGVAFSVHEITVGDFRRFIEATGHRTRAERRGYSMSYDERSGNFIRRSRVDWRSAYDGARAPDEAPVLHVSAGDAGAYADWLSRESGQTYRLPSDAEFEYARRAGGDGPGPWGHGRPPRGAGNVTGGLDRSPGGRDWGNAFAGYGDGYWGTAPVGSFAPNAFGVHDLAGNVSEWVGDCWHDGYRRAPVDGAAWINAGCRTKVVRGGSWASAPVQTRSSWRAPAPVDTTNARVGFRVARDL